jgi:hypothetical protein
VSNRVELLSNGSRALERLPSLAPDGAPSLPFYRSKERLGVHERERKREIRKQRKRKSREEET